MTDRRYLEVVQNGDGTFKIYECWGKHKIVLISKATHDESVALLETGNSFFNYLEFCKSQRVA